MLKGFQKMSTSSVVKHWTVFVYGTLKRGEPNHHWLSNTSNGFQEFLGAARMAKRFPLVIASRYNVPYLLDQGRKAVCSRALTNTVYHKPPFDRSDGIRSVSSLIDNFAYSVHMG